MKTSNSFDVFISDIVLLELERCNAPKTSFLLEKLNEIKPVIVRHGEAIEVLAQDFLKWGVLTPKSIDDIRHMACAVFIGCNLIASWNMKHFVNIKTTTKLIQACSVLGFTPVDIATPQKILEDYQNDDD